MLSQRDSRGFPTRYTRVTAAIASQSGIAISWNIKIARSAENQNGSRYIYEETLSRRRRLERETGTSNEGKRLFAKRIRLFSSARQTLARSNAFVSYGSNPFEEITTKNVENVVGGVRLPRK